MDEARQRDESMEQLADVGALRATHRAWLAEHYRRELERRERVLWLFCVTGAMVNELHDAIDPTWRIR